DRGGHRDRDAAGREGAGGAAAGQGVRQPGARAVAPGGAGGRAQELLLPVRDGGPEGGHARVPREAQGPVQGAVTMAEGKTSDAVVGYEVVNGVAWIRLNRPDRMNAVNGELRRALADAVKRAERDEAVRTVVVTGTGRAFCAGADVREF